MASWKTLEDFVRSIASLRYGAPCQNEHVGGVNVDGVVHLGQDEQVLIEITENMTLDKVRGDITKIAGVRMTLLLKGVSCKAFVVMDGDPTPAMVEQGTASHVTVLSVKKFENDFFDYEAYVRLRKAQPFGSAVDSETGENDRRKYVGVAFSEKPSGKKVDVRGLCDALIRGGKVVVTGDYGTGKSRLVREVFQELEARSRAVGAYVVAINLRDHWGSGNFLEILGGHLQRIGLSGSIDNAIRLLRSRNLMLLLDGFDEIGAQSHDHQLLDRTVLRKNALRGVRDLVEQTGAGLMITGRSHYFDDDQEMLDAIGLASSHQPRIVEVPPTFNREQAKAYLLELGLNIDPPTWLPMKPLVFQIAAELEKADLEKLLKADGGAFEFWGMFIGAVTRRESKGVKDSISPTRIHRVLIELGGISRNSKEYLGRFSPSDINEAYRIATGSMPDAVGQQLLARMCTLGRIEPESPDRQFLDSNIVEVVRAEHLITKVVALDEQSTRSKWNIGLTAVGIMHAATAVYHFDMVQLCHAVLNKYATSANTVLLGEVISILTLCAKDHIDFKGISLKYGVVPVLMMSDVRLSNLDIVSSEIGLVDLDLKTLSGATNVTIRDSIVSFVTGITNASALPSWMDGTSVLEYDLNVSSSSKIKANELPPGQKLLLSIIHKVFFQPGKGREEASLLKGGYGKRFDQQAVDEILKKLLNEGLIEKIKGDEGAVYKPVRRFTERMARIKSELVLSEDPLWTWAATVRF
jgi:hypothetical protein